MSSSATTTAPRAARLTAASIGASGVDQYGFSYEYDGLQNMIERDITGPATLGAI